MSNEYKVNGVSYRQRFNTCNNPDCKCHRGEKHGPYWYGHGDMGTPKYMGKVLPSWITDHVALLKKNAPKLKTLKAKIQGRIDAARRDLERAETELRTVQALESGEWAASQVLRDLGLAQFNGHDLVQPGARPGKQETRDHDDD